ncbi:hypothetical protein [Falsiroseomonas oryzae]|uniref:hypothetical protein n=1 Tax=Falsiroseomonas oryzae TaxID=2766473 RepID=UPI0022EB7800|nr:hypothetical protein [Roseomonas sp. MO-31]
MPERFEVYRYEIVRPGVAPEARYTFAPMKGVGYAGNDEPSEAHPMGNEPAEAGQAAPAGHVEAPEGSRIASFEPPILEIPGRGRVDLDAVIGTTGGKAAELGRLVRWHPAG